MNWSHRRKIKSRKGSTCLLECGHSKKSRGKNHAECLQCKEEGVWLFSSFGEPYLIKTTKTDHESCMEKLAHKCNWERMSRLGILIEYPKMMCETCNEKIGLRKV